MTPRVCVFAAAGVAIGAGGEWWGWAGRRCSASQPSSLAVAGALIAARAPHHEATHRAARQLRRLGSRRDPKSEGGEGSVRAGRVLIADLSVMMDPIVCRRRVRFRPVPARCCHARRIRIAPLAVDGSTIDPPCVMTISPDATSRRAAERVGSIRERHSASPTILAASLGQIDAPAARWSRSSRIAPSSSWSTVFTFRDRQRSEQ